MFILPYSAESIQDQADKYLTAAELVYWHSLVGQNKKRAEWLAGRIAAKEAISELLVQDNLILGYKEIFIERKPSGQPFFKDIGISISHTENYAAAEATKLGPVGIDIENIRGFPDLVYEKFLTDNEKQWLNSLDESERNSNTTLLWSLKESYLKALGVGLRKHMSEIELSKANANFSLQDNGLDINLDLWYNINRQENYVVTRVLLKPLLEK